jgi:hypothetical protein
VRIKATEMVGVRLTTREIQRLLDALAEGKLGPADDPELVALRRKLNVMLQVSTEVERRPRPWEITR